MKAYKLFFLFLFIWPLFMQAQDVVKIVPLPVEIKTADGIFIIDEQTSLVFDVQNVEMNALARYFAAHIKDISGMKLQTNAKTKKSIRLALKKSGSSGDEGYTMRIQNTGIEITGNKYAGVFYGVQSLFQILPAIRTNELLKVPCMEINDEPAFSWRGFMLDVSRHFFSPETIKDLIDVMAAFKLNTFHWHLTDDQGWRIEIKKYPKLTSIGGWRQEKEGAVFYEKDTAYLTGDETYTYGGYYSQEQISDILAYARQRNVTIIPEIEMPGHSGAALAAYPQYSCAKTPQSVPNIQASGNFDSFHSNYCPGNPATFTFLENILLEVMQLFPSEYIHIGGDEVDKKAWKACNSCQELMKKENLKNEEELQSYFISRIENFIISKGRKMIGWGEILEGGLAPEATVMSWIGEKRGIEAAQMNHDVIMCPSDPMYFNRYQTENIENEPHAARFSINTLEKVYTYNPIPKVLNMQEKKYILGSQALVWTEFISSVEHLEYMLLPRLCALAENVWTPVEQKNFESFKMRLKPSLKAFSQKGIRYFDKEK